MCRAPTGAPCPELSSRGAPPLPAREGGYRHLIAIQLYSKASRTSGVHYYYVVVSISKSKQASRSFFSLHNHGSQKVADKPSRHHPPTNQTTRQPNRQDRQHRHHQAHRRTRHHSHHRQHPADPRHASHSTAPARPLRIRRSPTTRTHTAALAARPPLRRRPAASGGGPAPPNACAPGSRRTPGGRRLRCAPRPGPPGACRRAVAARRRAAPR